MNNTPQTLNDAIAANRENSGENPTTGFFSGVADIEKYIEIARNNKLIIAGVLALALAIGLIVTMLTTPLYLATTRVEINTVQQNVTDIEAVEIDRRLSDRSYLPTQYELLESRSLAQRVVRELDLVNDDQFRDAFDLNELPASDAENRIVGILLRNVRISPITGSILVDISFSSPDRTLSPRIANAWADAYIAENLDRRFGATRDARDVLQERIQQTRERLEEAERAVIAYATNEGLITLDAETGDGDSSSTASRTLVATELAEANNALQAAIADRIAAEAALSARNSGNSVTTEDFGSGTVSALRSSRAELRVELADLRARFSENYPPVQALEDQIAELDGLIAEEQSAARGRLQAAYSEALSREQRLRARVSDLQGNFAAQRQTSVEYNILQREVDTNRELYAGLLQRFREIGVADVGESNIAVIDEARVPSGPYKPNLISNLMIALVLGALVVVAGIFVYDLMNQSLRDPRQVKSRLGLELLASIPRQRENELMDELSSSYSELYESYFSLTSSLAFAAGGRIPRSIMVTSSRPGEGKSVSSVAIAYLLSRQGKRVLLLDCDLRKSGISQYLENRQTVGTTQYLSGNDDWRSMIASPDPLEGFDVIQAGRKASSAAELLANSRLQMLLDQLEEHYDHVVVDGPPVLGLVDAPLMASSLGGVVLIVEANQGKWRFIESAVSRLRQSNAEIIGAAVTKLDDRNVLYGYGSDYGYGYGKETEPEDEARAIG